MCISHLWGHGGLPNAFNVNLACKELCININNKNRRERLLAAVLAEMGVDTTHEAYQTLSESLAQCINSKPELLKLANNCNTEDKLSIYSSSIPKWIILKTII